MYGELCSAYLCCWGSPARSPAAAPLSGSSGPGWWRPAGSPRAVEGEWASTAAWPGTGRRPGPPSPARGSPLVPRPVPGSDRRPELEIHPLWAPAPPGEPRAAAEAHPPPPEPASEGWREEKLINIEENGFGVFLMCTINKQNVILNMCCCCCCPLTATGWRQSQTF